VFSGLQLGLQVSFTKDVFDSEFSPIAGPYIWRGVPMTPNSTTVFNINRS